MKTMTINFSWLVVHWTTRHALIDYPARNPTAGDLMPGTGGVRKLRWQGKREPEGPTRAYLLVIDRAPQVVQKALRIA